MRTIPMPSAAAAGAAVSRLPAVSASPAGLSGSSGPAILTSRPERQEARDLIARLREHIARREEQAFRLEEKRRPAQGRLPWTLGLAAVDGHLPEAGLARSGLHDVSPAAYGDFPAACGFALALATRRLADPQERRPLLWCRLETQVREYGRSHGYGIEQMGVSRQRFLSVSLRKPMAVFWTVEEALKSGALAVVLGDAAVQQTNLTTTRRLALSGQEGRACGIIVLTQNYKDSTASFSRWCVATTTSPSAGLDPRAPGPPAWQVNLSRIRGGRPGQWTLTWQQHHASHRFTLVPGLFGGALHPGAAEGPGPRTAAEPALRAG